ncbi:AAA family ATPase [Telluribacter sp.]|jgi:predicted ATPase|uniref:AAA family ATPase n=1 Tax=Telluribacter sp. TaxID=1978767 RepID=UPI002E0DFD8E|nr:AAA family ATPase [Telluribacter sp.]
MKLKKLHIKNFKSLVNLEIDEPNTFTVFVGANGVGKSNIFEALEFNAASIASPGLYQRLFGSKEDLLSKNASDSTIEVALTLDTIGTYITSYDFSESPIWGRELGRDHDFNNPEHNNINNFWLRAFSRIFIGNRKEVKFLIKDNLNLALDGSNLEKVLKRLLQDERKREEMVEYLQLFIPEFENIEVYTDNVGGTDTLLFYEKGTSRPYGKNLISNGSYNILCLLTAVLQSDSPQFLCIEEPENGLTPYAIEAFVEFFRNKCEERGHYIWLNTHSQTLVRQLREEELILVDKQEGATRVKQLKKGDFFGLKADEAWLTNALDAGLPW